MLRCGLAATYGKLAISRIRYHARIAFAWHSTSSLGDEECDTLSPLLNPWLNKNKSVPYGYWLKDKNRRSYCDWLGAHQRCRRFAQFYRLSHQVLEGNRGSGLLNLYNQSFSAALKNIYCLFNWRLWEFKDTSKQFWSRAQHQLDFLDWLGLQLGIRRYSDWNRVHLHEFESRGFSAILFYHKHSVLQTLADVYNAYYFSPWTFDKPTNEYWKAPRHLAGMLVFLENRLKIQDVEDWNRITHSRLKDTRLLSAILKIGGLDKFLSPFYPDKDWSPLRIRLKEKSQHL
jgi:hypothetical protein